MNKIVDLSCIKTVQKQFKNDDTPFRLNFEFPIFQVFEE